ncbi:Esterase [Gammaproteobacteria bacterium]
MRGTKLKHSASIFLLALGLGACTPHQQYRAKVNLCVNSSATPSAECELHALQRFQDSTTKADQNYLLGFIEFDDQGMAFDRQQVEAVVKAIYDESVGNDLLITVFVHGWQHNAAPEDDNIGVFRDLLGRLGELEKNLSANYQEPPRHVVGVYLGWRGRSITTPVIDNLTFWERQNTAQKIGEVGLGEVLSRLEQIKLDKDSIVRGRNRTRLAIIGNGLGGTAVYSALAQPLKSRFIQTMAPEGAQGDVVGFGNLVILVNPTISALQFSTLSDMAAARGSYFGSQRPVLAVLTSETDYVTKMFFPFGRRLTTLFENERKINRWNAMIKKNEIIDESVTNVTAIGHFPLYETHYLHTSPDLPVKDQSKLVENFYKTYRSWILDYPENQIQFNGSVLERTNHSAGRNPFLVTQVNRNLINDHGDISNERLLEFIKELIMISGQTPKMAETIRSEVGSLRP